MRTSSTENLKQNAPYYMLKNKTKKLDNSLQSSRDERNSLNGISKGESSLSRTSSSSTTLTKTKKPFFDMKQTNTEIITKMEKAFLHKSLVEAGPSNPTTTTKKERIERSVSKDKRPPSEDIVRKILSSPQVKPSSANLENSETKSAALIKSFSPKFTLDSIYSHRYLLSATKSPSLQSPQPDEMPTPKIEVKEFNATPNATPIHPTHSRTNSRANSRAPSEGRASNSTNVSGSVRSNSKQRDSELSSKEPAKVFDRLYQEKGLKTLFGRNAASGPSITLKDIQFSRKGELKLKETTIQGPRYDPGSIASPKIVNYWINSSKENVPQSPKSFELSRGQHQFSGSSRGPVIAKPIAIKISENFTTHEAPRLSRNNSQVMCPEPEVVKNNETQGQTQESCEPYQRSNQVYIQDVLNNREILRDSTNYYPELTEGSETTTTLKPTVREMAAEKLKMLQRELAMHNNDIPEEDEEDVTPYQPTLLKAPSDLKAPLNIIDEVGECSSAGPSRKQSRSSVLDNQPVHFHYYIQTGL